ncbi:MAG: hypothetical protein WA369_09535 [Candidatus Acidiferrales bacterium]
MGDEAGGGFDDAGGADGDEDGAEAEGLKDFVHAERGFAEPADVRANATAAMAARELGGPSLRTAGKFVGIRVVEGRLFAGVAAAFEKFAVHVDDADRASLFVEIVDILRAEVQAVAEAFFERGESEMSGIRFRGCGDAAAHGIKFPDELRIALPCGGRGDVFEAVVAPKAAFIAERRNAAFGADAGAGEDENEVVRREFDHRPIVYCDTIRGRLRMVG